MGPIAQVFDISAENPLFREADDCWLALRSGQCRS
jgi:hypothetical protein